jgi:hypothetical protein
MIRRNQYNRLNRMSSKTGIVILFLLAHLVLILMMVFTFPRINAQFGTQAFDLKTFGYSVEEATLMIQNLDQSTIDFYIFPQLLLLDILYPILLALFLSTLIIRLSNLIGLSPHHIYSNLFILPFIAMFIDYLENSMILVMISNPEEISSGLIKTASIFTQMKAAFTTMSWLVILILFVIWLTKKWKYKNEQSVKPKLH